MRKAIVGGLVGVVIGVAIACGGSTASNCPSDPQELGACSVEGQACAQPNLHCVSGPSTLTCTNGTWTEPVDCHGAMGCGMFNTQQFTVDPNKCAPQLATATSCAGAVCSYTVEVPCTTSALDAGSEGGLSGDAGDGGDGGVDCKAACAAAAPSNTSPAQFCFVSSVPDASGAYTIACGGCGV